MPKTAIISDYQDLMKLLSAPNIIVKSIVDTLGGKIVVTYQEQEGLDTSYTTNVMLAATVTASARICLYNLLDILKERVIYFDTGKRDTFYFYKSQ